MPTEASAHRPSPSSAARLLNSALAGLVGAGGSAGCAKSNDTTCAPAAATYVNVVSKDKVIALNDFAAQCATRGGFVQTSAWCSGSNLCKGLSYNAGTLTDHSCKGMNTCEGFSCVDAPADKGATGASVYAASCKGCHDSSGKFTVFAPPGQGAARLASFASSSDLLLWSTVAFGTQGQNHNGYNFSNMPAFREQLSRGEIQRVVAHIKTLSAVPSEYAGQD